jgi:hypothetical protein
MAKHHRRHHVKHHRHHRSNPSGEAIGGVMRSIPAAAIGAAGAIGLAAVAPKVLSTQSANVRTAALAGSCVVLGGLAHIGGFAPNVGKGLIAAGLGVSAVQVAQQNSTSMPSWLQLGGGTGCGTGLERRCLAPCAAGTQRLADGTCGTPGTVAAAPSGYPLPQGYRNRMVNR